MLQLLATLPGRLALPLAVVFSPYLLIRLVSPGGPIHETIAKTGVAAMLLNLAVPLALHVSGAPLNAASLALAHAALFAALAGLTTLLRRPFRNAIPFPAELRIPLAIAGLFALWVAPFTNLPGIDTYKWQDLATAVRVEENIPWLVHPLSLFGFTPRSYPSAQPLLLATVQTLGSMGVDAGYYVVSLLSGITGIFASYALGRRLFGNPAAANWLMFLYATAPVFTRYHHWATGRGLFISVLPMFLFFLLKTPAPSALAGTAGTAILLALCHKTGFVAVWPILAATLLTPALPHQRRRVVRVLLAIPFLAAAVLLAPRVLLPAPAGQVLGLLRNGISRFGCLAPLAALGWLAPDAWFSVPGGRRLFLPLLFMLPFAFTADMYGAMAALPFVAISAVMGLEWLQSVFPAQARPIAWTTAGLGLTGALLIVAYRSSTAAPPSVRTAAAFLEAHDPRGPYRVVAPGRAQTQIQGYVSGCPRFHIRSASESLIRIPPPPAGAGDARDRFRAWTDYLRGLFVLSEAEVDWYGANPREYHVVIRGTGAVPRGAKLLFKDDEIAIYEGALPAGASPAKCMRSQTR